MATTTRIPADGVAVLEWGPPEAPLRVELRALPGGGAVVVTPDRHCRLIVGAASPGGNGAILALSPCCEPR